MRVCNRSTLRTTHRAATLLLSLAACSKTEPSAAVPKARDAGSEGLPDAAARDTGAGGGTADGSTSYTGDAALDDDAGMRAQPFDPVQDCELLSDKSEHSVAVSFADETGFALTPGLTGFGVAYQHDNCGALALMTVASLGDYPKPSVLFDNCAAVAQGVSLLHGGDGYRLTWVDNALGSAELQSLKLADSLKAPADLSGVRITNNAQRELGPVMASIGGTDLLSWIALDPASRSRQVMLQRADGTGAATALIEAGAGFNPTHLAMAQLGPDQAALAFVSEERKPGVYLQTLDGTGQPHGSPVALSGGGSSASASVDIATREEDGGAVIYSVGVAERYEVRFRRLNPQGAFLSDEIKVVSFPLHGRDASITRLGGGYVVVFRSMSEPNAARGEIRLLFVTKEGNLQRDSAGRVASYALTEASTTGGRITARLSRDGQLLLGFLDVGANGPELRLIRRRLDCPL